MPSVGGGRYFWSVVVQPMSSESQADLGTAAAKHERQNQTEISLEYCYGLGRKFSPRLEVEATDWRATNNTMNTYSHWLKPNAPRCQAVGPIPDAPFLSSNFGAASAHDQGVNVAFLDGHVQFVSDHIDELTWRAAGTRDGGESDGLPPFSVPGVMRVPVR
ncbi:MAG: hypothetical protein B7Z55_14435 [Planctomycetales bacterium 12-60-4]|nr:MAG: hypothetical protein B7Z55_14435 [Planctomycetales bacterium 12-60-4]